MHSLEVIDFGISTYRDMWNKQLFLRDSLVQAKKEKKEISTEFLLLGEHTPVYTLGFHGESRNLLISDEELKNKGIECIRIERGGDITFHGPGQLIVYPILDLDFHNIGVKNYIFLLEESIIELLNQYNIKGEKIEGATGVWIGKGTQCERKICAIGVKISRGTTMHGLALNVLTDLNYFSFINPCGFVDKDVTSIEKELGKKVNMELLKKQYIEIFTKYFYS